MFIHQHDKFCVYGLSDVVMLLASFVEQMDIVNVGSRGVQTFAGFCGDRFLLSLAPVSVVRRASQHGVFFPPRPSTPIFLLAYPWPTRGLLTAC